MSWTAIKCSGPVVALTSLTMTLLPRLAEACAVCSTGREDETNDAFLMMTGFMTLTPLIILGGTIVWFIRRTLKREREEAAEDDATGRRRDARPVGHLKALTDASPRG